MPTTPRWGWIHAPGCNISTSLIRSSKSSRSTTTCISFRRSRLKTLETGITRLTLIETIISTIKIPCLTIWTTFTVTQTITVTQCTKPIRSLTCIPTRSLSCMRWSIQITNTPISVSMGATETSISETITLLTPTRTETMCLWNRSVWIFLQPS